MDNKEEIMQKIKELEDKTEELKSMVGNLDKKEWANSFEESKELFPYWGFTDLNNNNKYLISPKNRIINADAYFCLGSEVSKFWESNGIVAPFTFNFTVHYKFKGFNSEKELYAWMAE